jgi:predicted GNAT family N-acyltransferase
VGDAVVGIARLTPDAQVGRMAVLPDWRGRGIGTALLRAVLQCAREKGLAVVTLHAQTHAVPFYARQGFRAEGAVFMEAGIPHRRMTLVIHEDE